ncbi:leucine-rich repeat-containing protein 15 [Episyrphus balteatus]|uniref:leucine-rich repeat-containing protein 15 n=1 Tax=Episyrphus balteatus TaxID=286459 RepID=UPI0024863399|nr:leucine-rich repeat-containing protein 15 [Episyrphus balteatus]
MLVLLLSALTIISVSNCQINSVVELKINDTYCSKTLCHGMNFSSTQVVVSFQRHNSNPQTSILFENSTFSNFPLNLFLTFPNLTELDMRNCSMNHVTWENFLWAVNLKVLFLSNNLLSKIDELVFCYALNLQFLWIENNRIRSLVSESFKGLTQLKYLSLLGNRITYLPDGLFDDLRSLEVVILTENRISSIQDNLFTKSPNLMSIDLKENRIHNISDDAFKGLEHIMKLDISQNKLLRSLILNVDASHFYVNSCSLRQVNIYGRVNFAQMNSNRILELYFSQPESLLRLDLRNNSLQQIASLTHAENLKILNLSDNPKLESVPDPWGVISLEKLDLSNTGLKEFPQSILGQKETPSQVYFLNISSNSIKQIDPKIFSRLENITNFYFHANTWNCFYLQLMMDLLINPRQMAYSRDAFNSLFAGEYIGGIECMYRSVEDENDNIALIKKTFSSSSEVDELRSELKTIVQFYEEKFAKVMETLENVKIKLDTLTMENATIWQHITLTT